MCFDFDIPEKHVTKVQYEPVRPLADMQKLFASEAAGHQEMNRWLNVKYDHWQYEKEWRANFDLKLKCQHPDGNYYEEFSSDLRLAEVMIGVRSILTRLDVNNLLGDIAEYVEITKARLSFKETYRVVQDRRFR